MLEQKLFLFKAYFKSLQIFHRMDLVEVMGKQNRKVPVLLTPVMKAAIERLIKHRDMCGVDPRNIYVFAKVIRGMLVMNIKIVPEMN